MPSDTISELSICNAALIKLGVDPITSLSQDTKAARLCNARYAYIRNKVLEDHSWSFATKTMELASVSGVDIEDWAYAFTIPGDMLKMIRGEDWDQRFDTIGGYFVCNESPFRIKYIWKNENVGTYSYNFAECVSWRLAADLAYALTKSNSVTELMVKGYEMDLKAARYHDVHKKTPEGPYADNWINVRS